MMKRASALALGMSFGIIGALFAGAVPAYAASLSQGSSGSAVIALQQALIEKGYLSQGSATGYFGLLTDAAVKKFQCDSGIICVNASVEGYGIYGPRTQAALQGSASVSATKPSSLEVSGWIPYWRADEGVLDALAHLDVFTEINPFGYGVSNDGLLTDPMKINEEPWTSLIEAAQKKKIRVIPTVMWSNGAAIHRILSNTQTRIALEDQIAILVKAEGFDGIDIDFEGKYAETAPYFSTFLKGLYQRMGNKWVMCTIEARTPLSSRYDGTPPEGAGVYANDFAAINKYCDRVRIMAYDQGSIDVTLNAKNEGPYVPVADSAWVEKVINLTAQTIPRHKLHIGVATYGYEYEVTPLTQEGYRYDRQWAFNPKYALDLASKLGLTPWRNSAGEMSFAYLPSMRASVAASEGVTPSGNLQHPTPTTSFSGAAGAAVAPAPALNILWWSDAKAIADKVALAKKLGVRGVSIFKIDGGQDPGMWNALK